MKSNFSEKYNININNIDEDNKHVNNINQKIGNEKTSKNQMLKINEYLRNLSQSMF